MIDDFVFLRKILGLVSLLNVYFGGYGDWIISTQIANPCLFLIRDMLNIIYCCKFGFRTTIVIARSRMKGMRNFLSCTLKFTLGSD
ncbi:hypothetical protein ACJX0J_029642, partial [Zea mays]